MLVSSDMIRQISTNFVMMPKINTILQQSSNIIKTPVFQDIFCQKHITHFKHQFYP